MRTSIGIGLPVSLALVVALALAVPAHAASGLAEPGRPAPAFVLDDAAGSSVTLAAFAGRPAVFNVFASWCPPCRSELPRIAAAARASKGRVAFLGVDEQEPAEMAERFVREMRLPYPVVYDHGQFAASYGAASLPVTVFVDARGVVRAIVHGAITPAELAGGLARIAPTTRRNT